jgi:hypothetical protein
VKRGKEGAYLRAGAVGVGLPGVVVGRAGGVDHHLDVDLVVRERVQDLSIAKRTRHIRTGRNRISGVITIVYLTSGPIMAISRHAIMPVNK